MKTKGKQIVYVFMLSLGICFVPTIKGYASMSENIKKLEERLGEKWSIIAKRMSDEYKNKELEKLEADRARLEKRIADNPEYLSKEKAERIRRYLALQRDFIKSKYFVIEGKLIVAPEPIELTVKEEKEIALINKALKALEGSVAVRDGAKVVVRPEGEYYVVIFEAMLPEGALGPDFSAKVFINRQTGKVEKILAGS